MRTWMIPIVVLAVSCTRETPRPDPDATTTPAAPAQDRLKDASAMIQAFIDDAAAGEHQKAYERMAEQYRSMVSFPRFQTALAQSPYFRSSKLEVRRTSSYAGLVEGEGYLSYPGGAVPLRFAATSTPDGWRITGLSLAGMPAIPSYAEPEPEASPRLNTRK